MTFSELRKIAGAIYGASGIKIKPENKGKFTDYCGGKVTDECIQKGLHSDNPTTRKRANFARNARTWKASRGMKISSNQLYQRMLDSILSGSRSEQTSSEQSQAEESEAIQLPDINENLFSKEWSILDYAPKSSTDFSDSTLKWSDPIEGLTEPDEADRQETEGSSPELNSSTVAQSNTTSFGNYGKRQKTADYIRNYLSRELNITPEQAEGFVINFNHESGFSSSVVAKPSSRGTKTYSGGDTGLAQWTGKRKQQFQRLYGKELKNATLEEQLNYVVWELKNKFPNLREALSKAKTPQEAAKAVLLGYEATSDNPTISDKAYRDIYVHSISQSLNQRLKHAGYN